MGKAKEVKNKLITFSLPLDLYDYVYESAGKEHIKISLYLCKILHRLKEACK